MQAVVLALGAGFVAVGWLWKDRLITRVLSKLVLASFAGAFVLLAAEVAFRAIGFDFSRSEQNFKAYPAYYRWPTVPVGEAYYRKPGNDSWTGQVLREGMRAERILDEAYLDEPTRTITYDRDGFRNPDTMTDWDVIVAGDSFVELGYLDYDDLFTTQLGMMLGGKRVRNLGVCHTGTFTHVCYLRHFGKAESARHAILSFFEGNDLLDMEKEHATLEAARQAGQRETRNFTRQPSFLKALRDAIRGRRAGRISSNALLKRADGAEVGVTLTYTPAGRETLTVNQRTLLGAGLTQWAEQSRAHGMKPWLLYMPCKDRVLADQVRFTDRTPAHVRAWKPTDLPQVVREMCDERGIAFVDPTSELTASSKAGGEPYNLIWDTHLTASGCRTVAEVLAAAFRAAGSY
jgi:hypothetical protein